MSHCGGEGGGSKFFAGKRGWGLPLFLLLCRSITFSPYVGKVIYADDIYADNAMYADDTTLYSKCDQVSDLWQQLELASELESDLRETVDCGRKGLVDFNAGKTELVSFD